MITHKRLQLTRLALALSIALAGSAPALAQNTTAAVGGRVSTSDGRPASGARVTIVHTESGSVSNVTADADGRYTARGLRVGGPYTITITKDGVVEKHDNVYLTLAETTTVDAQLGTPAIQTVNVTGQAASNKFNKSNMGSGTNIGRAELNALSSISRSLADYARNDPRLSQTDKDRGELSVGGMNSRFNSITIDGVSISDTFGLEGNGLPTNKQPISIDAIQSVQVNVSNYDVTQKGYLGANINAVTKSGTNTWHGSVYHVYRDDNMVGVRANTDGTYYRPPAFKETTTGVTLGGPLIKDKLFLFVSAEDSSSSRASPSFGPLGSNQNNVAITQSAIASLQSIAQSRWGMNVGSADVPSGLEQTVKDRLIKLDWNISDDHRASVRWQKTDQSEPQFSGFSASGVALSSYLWTEVKPYESAVAQVFSDWTPSLSTEFKLSQRDYGKANLNNAYLPAMALQFTGPVPAGAQPGTSANGRFINFGTENSRQFNELNTKTLDAYGAATWLVGKHEVKGGFDYSSNDIYNAFLQNVYGNYRFSCVSTYSYETGPINCLTASTAAIEAAVLENFRRGRPDQYTAQLPVAGVDLRDTAADWTLKNTGLFLQDTWAVTPRLNVTYGVRYDRAATDDRPRVNAAVAAPKVAGVYGTTNATLRRETGGFGIDNTVTIDGDSLIQPRVGFNYRLATERPAQIRGGVGLFRGAALNVWLGNPFANPGVSTYAVGCGRDNFGACNGIEIFNPDPTRQSALPGAIPAAAVDALAPGLSQPSVWKANLAAEHELPWFGLVASLEYLHTKVNTGIYFQHLNLGAPTRTGPDGRQMFWTEPGYTAACANGTGGFRSTGTDCTGYRARALSNAAFTNVIQATETKKGGGNLISATLSNARSKGVRWSASYTYTDATEVSNLSNSTSNSTWGARAIFNPNEDVAANSSYMVKDRVNASLIWEQAFFGTYKTSIGAFYEGRSGKPYSWTFNNDMNGDGTSGNDLMYIPKAFGSGDVLFYGATAAARTAAETRFWNTVNSTPELLRAAGGVVGRQDSFAPWTNSIDMRISQEIPGLFAGHKGALVFDFQNVGNMINKRWGRINEVGFSSAGGNARSFVDYAGMQDGKYVYQVRDRVEDYVTKQNRGESQWAIQVTARYEF